MLQAKSDHITVSRRVLLRTAVVVPALPAVAAIASAAPASPVWVALYAALPAAGTSVVSIIARARALVDMVNGDAWAVDLDEDQAEEVSNKLLDENHALFVRAANTPCQTVADALAKMNALEGEDYAGDGLLMEQYGDVSVESRYLADVRAFLARLQAGAR